jgi:hypothetical protein
MRKFFYKYWWLYYILFFLLLGLLIYALLWSPNLSRYNTTINDLNSKLEECENNQRIIDSTGTKVDKTINCDATVKSGGQGKTSTQHELGSSSGKVVIEFDMKNIPDEIKVYYDGQLVASSSGLVSGYNKLQWFYDAKTNKPTYCIVEISAPGDNTEWEYVLGCPN